MAIDSEMTEELDFLKPRILKAYGFFKAQLRIFLKPRRKTIAVQQSTKIRRNFIALQNLYLDIFTLYCNYILIYIMTNNLIRFTS